MMKKGTMELNVKVNMFQHSKSVKEQMKDLLKEMKEVRKENPDIKINVEVIR